MINWLQDKLIDPKHRLVFIGYNTYSLNKIITSMNGVWVGYDNGKPFFQMNYRDVTYKARMSDAMIVYLNSVDVLFQSVHRFLDPTEPPKIILSAKKAVQLLESRGYWYKKMKAEDKANIYRWMSIYCPKLDWYDSTDIPFSVLKELSVADKELINQYTVDKKFFDYKQFDE